MKQEELNKILRLHKLWIEGKAGGAQADLVGAHLESADLERADLKGAILLGANLSMAFLAGADLSGATLAGADLECADLEGADLRGADFREANLAGATLHGANLRGANIDDACWPLWCGSFDVKICSRIAAQLAYHVVRACQSVKDDADIVELCKNPELIKLANRFHRADECGRIEAAEGGAK